MADTCEEEFEIQVTARALITKENKLLLVTNDGRVWYTPGGRLEVGESLRDCIQREVFEETGLNVRARNLVHVFEYWEAKYHRHKVECYFLADLESGGLDQDWADLDGPVQQMKFFRLEDIEAEGHIYPEFLKKGAWRNSTGSEVYMGFER